MIYDLNEVLTRWPWSWKEIRVKYQYAELMSILLARRTVRRWLRLLVLRLVVAKTNPREGWLDAFGRLLSVSGSITVCPGFKKPVSNLPLTNRWSSISKTRGLFCHRMWDGPLSKMLDHVHVKVIPIIANGNRYPDVDQRNICAVMNNKLVLIQNNLRKEHMDISFQSMIKFELILHVYLIKYFIFKYVDEARRIDWIV